MSMGRSNTPQVKQIQQKVPTAEVITQIVEKEIIREIPVEYHYHNNTHHETVKTRDSRARNYVKAVKVSLENSHKKSCELLNKRMDIIYKHIEELENRKPEEKQILTVETKHVETIREVSTSIDKRILLIIAVVTALNIAVLLIK